MFLLHSSHILEHMKDERQSYKKRENVLGVKKWGFHQRNCVCNSMPTNGHPSGGACGLQRLNWWCSIKQELRYKARELGFYFEAGGKPLKSSWVTSFEISFWQQHWTGCSRDRRLVRRLCGNLGRRAESPATA